MKHEILGTIKRTKKDSPDGVSKVRYGSRRIEVRISRDDKDFETAVQFAAEVVQRLEKLDKKAKQIAAADLRDNYNNGWNEYDEVQDDGSLKAVSNPKLSKVAFERKLTLRSIKVSGDCCVDFFYDDEGMFWGHSVIVTSLNGINFRDAWAELFG